MKLIKVYISSGVFIALTAIKLMLPQASSELCEGITKVLHFEAEQTEALLTFGSSIAENGIIETLHLDDLEFLSD